MCPRERLVILSNTTGLSFAKERIGPLAAFIPTVFYLLVLCLLALSKKTKIRLLSICREFLIHTTSQHLLLLVGFDTLTYRKYYDTPPILVGHQDYFLAPLPGSEALLESGTGKRNFYYEYCLLLLVALFSLWIIR